MSESHANRSIPEIFSDLVDQLTTLLKNEARLARTEVSEKIGHIAGGVAFVAIGAVVAIPALVILLQAIVAALVRAGLAIDLSSLIVGGLTLVIGILLLISGMNRIKGENLVPQKTIHQLQRDAQVVKQETSDDHGLNRAA
jgi:hypothetical protein